MSYCFSGTTFSIPFFNDTTLPEKNHIELDGKEVEDSIYYINEETSVPDTITINTEYTDCADIGTTQSGSSSNYSQSVTIDNVTFDIVANPRLFVSPDIWYSVDSSIPLTGVF
jgi:hypothetical protein